jgi:hypothetical protein
MVGHCLSGAGSVESVATVYNCTMGLFFQHKL